MNTKLITVDGVLTVSAKPGEIEERSASINSVGFQIKELIEDDEDSYIFDIEKEVKSQAEAITSFVQLITFPWIALYDISITKRIV